MVKATTIVAGIALSLAGAPAAAQPGDTFTPARAEGYAGVTDWPDLTGVWSPDWRYLFASRGARRASSPVLTPEAQAKYNAFLDRQEREGVNQYLQVNCIPPGMPNIMRQPYPIEFLFSPRRVTLLTETYSQARRLYLDGRALPEDPEPLFNGTSVGRWEGDMLVVNTVGFNRLVTYQSGIQPSPKMRIHEHFWLAEPDVLMVQTTITDPGVLAEPLVQLQAYASPIGTCVNMSARRTTDSPTKKAVPISTSASTNWTAIRSPPARRLRTGQLGLPSPHRRHPDLHRFHR